MVPRCLLPSRIGLGKLFILEPVHVRLLVIHIVATVSDICISPWSGPAKVLVVDFIIYLVLTILLLLHYSLLLHLSLVLLIQFAVHISFVVIHFQFSLLGRLVIIRQLYHVFNPFVLDFALCAVG